jgi:hypothetical protein
MKTETRFQWLTNDPEAARALRAADKAHDKARAKAINLPLAEKVKAYRQAKDIKIAAYAAIRNTMKGE